MLLNPSPTSEFCVVPSTLLSFINPSLQPYDTRSGLQGKAIISRVEVSRRKEMALSKKLTYIVFCIETRSGVHFLHHLLLCRHRLYYV